MPRLPQKFPPKESNSELQSDAEKYDDVLDSLTSLQTKNKNSHPQSGSSIKPKTLIIAIIVISIFSVSLLSLGSLMDGKENKDPNALFGKFTPGWNLTDGLDFKFQLLDESEVMVSNYAGEPIIIDLFATWCEPCKTQISHLQTVRSQYPNVRILSISVDLLDTRTMLTNYKTTQGMNWTVGRDITRQGGSIYQANFIPTMAFFDADAKLQHWEIGVTTAATLISWINGN